MFSTQVRTDGVIIRTMVCFFFDCGDRGEQKAHQRKNSVFSARDFTDLCLCPAQSAVASPPPTSPCPAPSDQFSRLRLEASFTLSCSIFCSISFSLRPVLFFIMNSRYSQLFDVHSHAPLSPSPSIFLSLVLGFDNPEGLEVQYQSNS